MKELNITIVGAGGGASYLIPQLVRLYYPIKRLTIYDADILEERNLDRQLFAQEDIGLNKATALASVNKLYEKVNEVVIKKEWFTEATIIPEDEDIIYSCVDNHPARRAILNTLDEQDTNKTGSIYVGASPLALQSCTKAIFLGNEYFDSEAYIYYPFWKNSNFDPRIAFPEIATSEENDPTSCQGVAQIANPQLTTANARSADHALHLTYIWQETLLEMISYPWDEVYDAYRNLPYYIRSEKYNIITQTLNQVEQQNENTGITQ